MGTEKSPYCNCLYYSANALSRLMTRMADEEFALAGVSSSYAFLLMTVNGQPGIQPKEISQKRQLTPSTVTRFLMAGQWNAWTSGFGSASPDVSITM